MKSKKLLLLAIPSLLICINSCVKEEIVFDNKIQINALSYATGENLPSPCDSFFLSICRMADLDANSMTIIDKPYLDSVHGSYLFTPPAFGRYVISVSLDDKKDVIDILYKGGDLSLSLIMR